MCGFYLLLAKRCNQMKAFLGCVSFLEATKGPSKIHTNLVGGGTTMREIASCRAFEKLTSHISEFQPIPTGLLIGSSLSESCSS